jgi:hypothetical protein
MADGYTKEKADALIQKHEAEAARLEQEARDLAILTHPLSLSQAGAGIERDELEAKAAQERQRADNLRNLKTHWGD